MAVAVDGASSSGAEVSNMGNIRLDDVSLSLSLASLPSESLMLLLVSKSDWSKTRNPCGETDTPATLP